jgi:hypothetical protein
MFIFSLKTKSFCNTHIISIQEESEDDFLRPVH